MDWMDGWMDTPQTVTTTRAPAVLTITAIVNCSWKLLQALEFDPYDGKFIPPEKRGTDIDYFRGWIMDRVHNP